MDDPSLVGTGLTALDVALTVVDNGTTEDENAVTVAGFAMTVADNRMTEDDNCMTGKENRMTEDGNAMTEDEVAMTEDENVMTEDEGGVPVAGNCVWGVDGSPLVGDGSILVDGVPRVTVDERLTAPRTGSAQAGFCPILVGF